MGYTVPNEGDEVTIPSDLCRPLRILGDLHFNKEESPGNVDLDQTPSIAENYSDALSPDAEAKLREYIQTHPRFTQEAKVELSEDLDRLHSGDNQVSTDDFQSHESTGKGPAASVDVDPNEYFGGVNDLSTELQDFVSSKEPPNVGEEIPEQMEKILGQIDRNEYYRSITAIPDHRKSLQEFADHPREIDTIHTDDGKLRYHLAIVDHPNQGEWMIRVTDGRRCDGVNSDLQYIFNIFHGEPSSLVTHDIRISDGQFNSWEITIGEEQITGGVSDNQTVEGAVFHQVLHDKNWILCFIEKFVDNLENAEIHAPANWTNAD